jgi:uncharacterized membrane protein YhaH (DUF805 family)
MREQMLSCRELRDSKVHSGLWATMNHISCHKPNAWIIEPFVATVGISSYLINFFFLLGSLCSPSWP